MRRLPPPIVPAALRPWAVVWAAVMLGCLGNAASAQTIYSCVDAKGRRLTSDRPIPECIDREQRLLNRDGSQRGVVGPSMTAEERAAYEEAQRRRQAEETARKDVVRHDRNLLARYPDAAAHQRARENALEPVEQALVTAEKRLQDLAKERQQLATETEFYKGKTLPRKLKQQFEQNEAATEAQRHSIEQHTTERRRVNALFDDELVRLKKLWGGAQPGSVGPIPSVTTSMNGSAVSPAPASTAR